MHILLNGEIQDVSEGETLRGLIGEYSDIAVAVNENVIPQDQWNDWAIKPNDRIDVISPFQGG